MMDLEVSEDVTLDTAPESGPPMAQTEKVEFTVLAILKRGSYLGLFLAIFRLKMDLFTFEQ